MELEGVRKKTELWCAHWHLQRAKIQQMDVANEHSRDLQRCWICYALFAPAAKAATHSKDLCDPAIFAEAPAKTLEGKPHEPEQGKGPVSTWGFSPGDQIECNGLVEPVKATEENLRDMLDFALLGHDIMDALGLEDQIVVGHSMGGMIAAEMAAIAPHDITRLALISPAGLWLDEHPIPDLFSKLPFELPELLFHDVELGKELMTAGLDFGDPEFLKNFLVINARRLGTAGKILFPIPERGLSQRLYRIRARTKVIWGESDKLIVPHYADAFVGAIAGAVATAVALRAALRDGRQRRGLEVAPAPHRRRVAVRGEVQVVRHSVCVFLSM